MIQCRGPYVRHDFVAGSSFEIKLQGIGNLVELAMCLICPELILQMWQKGRQTVSYLEYALSKPPYNARCVS